MPSNQNIQKLTSNVVQIVLKYAKIALMKSEIKFDDS